MNDDSTRRPASPHLASSLLTRWLALPLLAASLWTAGPMSAQMPSDEARDFDARVAHNKSLDMAPAASQVQKVQEFKQAHPDLLTSFDVTTGVTRSLYNPTGYLSEPQSGDASALADAFLAEHLALLGLSAADVASFEVTDDVVSTPTGARRLYLRQTHAGLPVFNGQLHFNFNRDGRLISVNNAFFPNLAAAVPSATPNVDAFGALDLATQHLGIAVESAPQMLQAASGPNRRTVLRWDAMSYEDIEAQLMWLPVRRGEVQLVWNFQLFTPDRTHMYDFNIDAHSGDVWTRFDWVEDASYRVFQQPVESPNHSSMPPPADGRMLIVDPEDATASPLGWHDNGTTSFTTLEGNNVHAFDDLNGDNQPPAVEPDCGAGLVCDFDNPIDFGSDQPTDYTSASVTNLFYWANVIHDIQYQYGFDEAAGNFQTNNFANGGLGNDEVTAFGQKSGVPCPNNAFFGTPADGSSPSMIMCLWTPSNPQRDFSFDNGVVIHEYGHGISNRLVGGPSNASCLGNNQQPGEGLSDWWSLAYTGEVGDQGTDVRGSGTYILGQPLGGPGVRTQPYSTDPAVNNHDYESINGMSIPHGVGEVWAQVAWEAYWALVDVYGFDDDLYEALGSAGNQRMMLYVNEGLKNTACSPTFTDVRDGIIQAATDNHGGQDVCILWEAFAAFGLGVDAISGGSGSTNPTNGFTLPASCLVGGAIFADGFESGDVSAWSNSVP